MTRAMATASQNRSPKTANTRAKSSWLVAILAISFVAIFTIGMISGVFGIRRDMSYLSLQVNPLLQASEQLRFNALAYHTNELASIAGGQDQGGQTGALAASIRSEALILGTLSNRDTLPLGAVLTISSDYQALQSVSGAVSTALATGNGPLATRLVLGPEAVVISALSSDAAEIHSYLAKRATVITLSESSRTELLLGLGLGMVAAGIIALYLSIKLQLIVARKPVVEVYYAAQRGAIPELHQIATATGGSEASAIASLFADALEGLVSKEQALSAKIWEQEFSSSFTSAIENAEDENHVLEVTQRALSWLDPNLRSELLIADSSRSHMRRLTFTSPDDQPPDCTVDSPWKCPAIRLGRALNYPSSEKIDACSRLRGRSYGRCSAYCVPVTFMGRAIGVLHTVGKEYESLVADTERRVVQVAATTGTRLGMLRQFLATQLQAQTDSLTGLLNRRSFESQIISLLETGADFALLMIDLDHFKDLNDIHGHQVGDKALRAFSAVLTNSVRPTDFICRYGGEEFAVVLSGAASQQAIDFSKRVAVGLAEACLVGDYPLFSASFGIAATIESRDLDDLVKAADEALYAAKRLGRNQACYRDPITRNFATTGSFSSLTVLDLREGGTPIVDQPQMRTEPD